MMESLPDASQKFVQYLLDYIFPPCCAACQRRGTILCPSCIAQVRPVPAPYYQQCHTPRTNNTTCRNCRYDPLHFNGLRVMSSYTGPLRTCIRALKYQGQKRLAGPLGTLLAQAYATYQLQADLIVPVPLHTERIKQRGYNQSQLLAKVCATQLHVPLETSLLTRVRPTAAQVNLKPSERQRNVANAFRAHLQAAYRWSRASVLCWSTTFAQRARRWEPVPRHSSRREHRAYGGWYWRAHCSDLHLQACN
jgi:ComF family protein